jgi:hypothetical protein
MDQQRQESQLEIARRYVRQGEERIARLRKLIEYSRTLEQPTDDLERLLARYRDWLETARLYLEVQESEAAGRSMERQ